MKKPVDYKLPADLGACCYFGRLTCETAEVRFFEVTAIVQVDASPGTLRCGSCDDRLCNVGLCDGKGKNLEGTVQTYI